MLIGMIGVPLCIIIFDLLNVDNTTPLYGYLITYVFGLMMILPIFTFKDSQKTLEEYKV